MGWIHGRAEGSVNGNALAGCDIPQQGQIGGSTLASTRVHHERCAALGGHSVERHSGEVINAFTCVRALPVFEMCKNNSVAGDWSGGRNVNWRLRSWDRKFLDQEGHRVSDTNYAGAFEEGRRHVVLR